ncbi:MAG: hypothetical protein ACK58T_35460, partial [Phycisphaerae bacterium]
MGEPKRPEQQTRQLSTTNECRPGKKLANPGVGGIVVRGSTSLLPRWLAPYSEPTGCQLACS